MDLDELIRWFEVAPGDPRRLRSLTGSLGIELTRRRLDHVAAALDALRRADAAVPALGHARLGTDPSDPRYLAGYVTAVEDLLRAFQAELGEEQTEREVLHYVRTEPYRSVLSALAAGAETATEVAAAMGKHKSSASRALAALREAGLVAAYSAPDGNDRLRPHALTLRGQRVVAELRGQRGRRGDGSRSSSADKAAARKKTPGKGNRPSSAAAAGTRRR
ncbi:MAG TPA: helix-turn-helix domain-containing protein [Kofleriaceae bacterium]|jgi:DNA-binding transcriptional ArsR family regulator|nr:helix-turn-helix domain-containing protein [Kofleriaceae bacterium]